MRYISYDQALSKAAEICSRSEKCAYDIIKKLNSWGLDPDKHQKIIDYLIDNNFIDHQRYANAFCNDKFKYNRWGKLKIKFQLKAKSIESAHINKALERIDNSEYWDTLEELLINKLSSMKFDDKYSAKTKMLNFGASRGFESNTLYDVVEKIFNLMNESGELENIE
jgi:regulatory protein